MRELFEEGIGPSVLDPGEALRRAARRPLPKRFYKSVTIGEHAQAFAILLDGRPVKTPAKHELAVPSHPVAEAIAAEWQAQGELIDPATMPVTRLANSVLDGVAPRADEVTADIAKYFGSDLLFYRADAPEGLVARQSAHWDPILTWATDELGARFTLAEGVMHVHQPEAAVSAARAAIPRAPWAIGALHSVTTLTGSALLALALAHGFRDAEAIWAAAHVDEDWNMEQWGRDELALDRRTARRAEFDAAALVLKVMGLNSALGPPRCEQP
jgi:chaperone required for assembly of F1-ATPase